MFLVQISLFISRIARKNAKNTKFCAKFLELRKRVCIFAAFITKTEMKRGSMIEEHGARKSVTAELKKHINRDKLEELLKMPKYLRSDAVEHLVRNAVAISDMLSFSCIPHVYVESLGKYIPFDYYELEMSIYDAMRSVGIPDGFYGGLSKIVKLCWAEISSRKAQIDTNVIVMKNGVFDTMDMKLHPWSPDYRTNMSVDYEYKETDEAVLWGRFLDEVLPDLEMQDLLQEFLALAYVDRRYVKVEHMLTLLGSGSNGKSVVFEVVTNLLGEGNITNFSIKDLISSARSDQNIATINGKRMNYCSEIRTSEIGENNSDAFKALVSGEAQMARSLYKEPFRAYNIPIIMANANRMPSLGDTSHALARRMLIIPFEVTIRAEEQNKELATQIMEEMPGVFNWVMQGFARLKRNQFQLQIPQAVKNVVAKYFRDNNQIMQWMEDNNWSVTPIKDNDTPLFRSKTEMYILYREWCLKNGEALPTKKQFASQMEMNNCICSRQAGGYKYRVYYAPTEAEVRKRNMDLAVKMQRREMIEEIEAKIAANEVLRVKGVEKCEMYLGLPKDTLYEALKMGILDGNFTISGMGEPMFDIRGVQMALADAGLYADLNNATGRKSIRVRAGRALGVMRRVFNSKMRAMGVPIRKYGNSRAYIPVKDKHCWCVPDDWQYTKSAAQQIMSESAESYNSKIKDTRPNEETDY